MTQGSVYWDDDDSNNTNSKGGVLPGGAFNDDTWIYFCCKTDGNKTDAILLPSKSPFYLLAYKSAKCQMVKWAVASLEWIYYDTEHTNNNDRVYGTYPHEAAKKHPTIYYCYYQGEKTKLLQALKLTVCASFSFQTSIFFFFKPVNDVK